MADPRKPAWLSEAQQPPDRVPETADKLAPLLFDAEHRPITTEPDWAKQRSKLVMRWREFLGEIPTQRDVPSLKVLEEDRFEGVVRQLVQYEAEAGLPVEAYLLRPESEGGGRPGVVVLHSTVDYTIRQPAGLEGPKDVHIGVHLARRGYVAICPRCFLWQYAEPKKIASAVEWLRQRHPHVKGMAKMLFDAIRAVDILVAERDVDRNRIGAIGHSLGAKEVLYLVAFDTRVRASVSSEGGIGLTYSNWDASWYLTESIRRPGFGLDHAQVLALSAPRAFLLVAGESADGDRSWPYIDAARPVWALTGAADAVGWFNHRQGHAFPSAAQERAYEWLDWFLRA